MIVASVGDEPCVKRLVRAEGRTWLHPDPVTERFRPIEIVKGMDFEVWGVVTFVIHPPRLAEQPEEVWPEYIGAEGVRDEQ